VALPAYLAGAITPAGVPMFLAHPAGRPPVVVVSKMESESAAWLDLLNPTEEEHALAAQLSGLRIPTRAEIEEIESSSRVYMEDQTFYLSTPLVRRIDDLSFTSPVGFVLSPDQLVTIRYTDYPVFETVGTRVARHSAPHSAEDTMVLLLEAIIDRIADLLEICGHDLDQISKRVFHSQDGNGGNVDRMLRSLLMEVGRKTDLVSSARDSLLGLQRVILYIGENGERPCKQRFGTRLNLLAKDISSLNDYDGQLNNKVQFLLDATLGFINIEQNNGIKILTVVSIVGIPPTLIASIYGMNFKNIPELNWSFGYWYALGLMAATILLPMIWFWRKGWLGGSR
jgi:magnesium transporter